MESESVSPTKSNSKSKKSNGQLIDQILARTKAQLTKVSSKSLLNGPPTPTTKKSVKRIPVNKQNLISELVTQELDALSKKSKRHSKELNSDVVTPKKIKVEKVSEHEYSDNTKHGNGHINNLTPCSTSLDSTMPIKSEKEDNYRLLSKERDELEKLFSNSTQIFEANSTFNANQKSPKLKLSDLSISRISKCGNTGSSSESEVPLSKPKKRKSSSSVNNTPNLKAIKEEIKSEDEVTRQFKVAINTEEPVKENLRLAHHHSSSSDNEPENNRDSSMKIIPSLESDKVSPQKRPNSKLISIRRKSNVSSKPQKKHNKAQLSQSDSIFGSSSDESNLPRSLETNHVPKRQTEPVPAKTKLYSESESESEEVALPKLLKHKEQIKQRKNAQRKNISLPVPLNSKILESDSEQVTFFKSSQVKPKKQQNEIPKKKLVLPVPLQKNSTSDSESDSERVSQAETKTRQKRGKHVSVPVPMKTSLSADSDGDLDDLNLPKPLQVKQEKLKPTKSKLSSQSEIVSEELTLPRPIQVKQEKSDKQKKHVPVPVPIKSRPSSGSESGSDELTLPKPLQVKQEKSNKQKNNVLVPLPIKSRQSSESESGSDELVLPKPLQVEQEKSNMQKNNVSVPLPIKSRQSSESESGSERLALPKPIQLKKEKSKKQKNRLSVPVPLTSRPSSGSESGSDELTLPKPLQVKQEKSNKQKNNLSVPLPIKSRQSSESESGSERLALPKPIQLKQEKSKKQKNRLSVPVPLKSRSSSDSEKEFEALPKPLQVKQEKSKKRKSHVSVPVPIKSRPSSDSNSDPQSLHLPRPLPVKERKSKKQEKHVSVPVPIRSNSSSHSDSDSQSLHLSKSLPVKERKRKKQNKHVSVPAPIKTRQSSGSDSSSEELMLPKPLQVQQGKQTTRKTHVLVSQRSKPELASSFIEERTGFQKMTSGVDRQKSKSRKEQVRVPVVAKAQHFSDSESSSDEEEPPNQKHTVNKPATITNQPEISDEDSDSNDPAISRTNRNSKHSYAEDERSAASGEQEAQDSARSSRSDQSAALTKSLPVKETLCINYKDTSNGSSSEDEDAHLNKSSGKKSLLLAEDKKKSKHLLGASKGSTTSNRFEEASSSSDDEVALPKPMKADSVNLTKAKRQRQKSESSLSSDVAPSIKRLRKESSSRELSPELETTRVASTSSEVKDSLFMLADGKHAYRNSLHEEATVAKPAAAELKSSKNLLLNNESSQLNYEGSDSEHALPMQNTFSDEMSWIQKLNLNFPGIEEQQIGTKLPEGNAKYSLLLVPKHINPSSLVNLKCHLNKETHVSLNNMEYVFQPLPKKPDPAIININGPKVVELESVIYFQQLVPQLPLNEVTVPVREDIMLPSEIKSRHPLFGANYKKQIRLDIGVKRKLQEAVERKQKVAEKERIKRKTKRKHIVGGVEENVLSIFNSIATTGDVATDMEVFPVQMEDSSFAKASKSKHSHKNGNLHANKKTKQKFLSRN